VIRQSAGNSWTFENRDEPDQGEVNGACFFGLLDDLGYAKLLGAEDKSNRSTDVMLGWNLHYRWLQLR
jgi:hydroxypyruvate isomerase